MDGALLPNESPFSIEVVISKANRRVDTGKTPGEGRVSAPAGPDFRMAIIRSTIARLQKDVVRWHKTASPDGAWRLEMPPPEAVEFQRAEAQGPAILGGEVN